MVIHLEHQQLQIRLEISGNSTEYRRGQSVFLAAAAVRIMAGPGEGSGVSLGISMATAAGINYVSKSPWFLTLNPDNQDVLIWKRGVRLRGSDGKSTGPVKGVKVFVEDRSIEVSSSSLEGVVSF